MSVPPLITLLTDFGEADPYVAMLKGVLLSGRPDLRLIDLTHRLPVGDARRAIFPAALWLRRVYPYYPAGTVHLIGQDCGLGSDRALIARAGGQIFLAPDSGVLGLVLEREITAARAGIAIFMVPAPSTPFLARDVLAPLALRLAGGAAPEDLGSACLDWRRMELPRPDVRDSVLRGEVLHVDPFGNLITNIAPADASKVRHGSVQVEINGASIVVGHAGYAEARPEELFWLWGADGWLEVSLLRASAAERLHAGPGTSVLLR